MILSISFCLAIFVAGSFCQEKECSRVAKLSFTYGLCKEKIKCDNETEQLAWDNHRNCFAKSSELAKTLIEEGNKLDMDKCVKHIFDGVCPLLNDIRNNHATYKECLSHQEQYHTQCHKAFSDSARHLIMFFSNIYCANASNVDCESTEGMELFNIAKTCIQDQIPELKEVNTEEDECKRGARNTIINTGSNEQDRLDDILGCMRSKKEDFHFMNLVTNCTGLFGY